MRRDFVIRNAASLVALSISARALAQYQAPDPRYTAPTHYYDNATGTGTTLRTNLHTIVSSGFVSRSYGDSRYAMGVGDSSDPNIPGGNEFVIDNTSNIQLVYNDAVIVGEWDAGTTWNREHVWPKALLNLTSSQVSNSYKGVASDAFELRPADPGVNSQRNDNGYGFYISNTNPGPTYGLNTNAGTTYWNPGAVDRGAVARDIFYMATRWFDPTDPVRGDSNTNLELKNGAPSDFNFGDLNSLLHWNYTSGVSNQERKQNQYVYGSSGDLTNHALNPNYYQGNRNPFIDHPEYVWAIWGTQANNSQIHVGASANGDGSSTTTASLRVMRNGAWGTTNVPITKTGSTPTTYDILASGGATSTGAGTGQPFDYNTQTRTLAVSLSSSTANTGVQSATFTIKNTDLTTAAAGQGSADANDTIQVTGQVVDNRTITATTYSGKVIRTSTFPITLSSPGQDDDHYTRVTVKSNSSGPDANGAAITFGSQATFNNATMTATRTLSANFSSVGTKTGTLSFTVGGEGLTGETVNPVSVTYNVSAVDHSEGSFALATNQDAASGDFDYVPQGFARTQTFSIYNMPAASGATADLVVSAPTASGDGANFSTSMGPGTTYTVSGGNHVDVSASVNTATVGTFAASYTFPVADENIPGATSGTALVYSTAAKVTAGAFPTTGNLQLLPAETWNPTDSFSIAGGVTLTTSGTGTLHVTTPQAHGANSSLIVNGPNLVLDTDAGSSSSAPLALRVGNIGTVGATAQFNSTQHLRSLQVDDLNSATMGAGGDKVLYTGTLSLGGSAKLDLNDNDLVVNSAAFSDVQALVFQGYRSSPDSSATGIISSTGQAAAGNPILALVDNALVGSGDFPFGSGQTVGASAILGKYTYFGDTNLDGQVTADDYGALDANFGASGVNPGVAWVIGDTNFDGSVTSDDYGTLDANFGLGVGNPLSANSSRVAVPEPAALSLIAAAGLLFTRRRRK